MVSKATNYLIEEFLEEYNTWHGKLIPHILRPSSQ